MKTWIVLVISILLFILALTLKKRGNTIGHLRDMIYSFILFIVSVFGIIISLIYIISA